MINLCLTPSDPYGPPCFKQDLSDGGLPAYPPGWEPPLPPPPAGNAGKGEGSGAASEGDGNAFKEVETRLTRKAVKDWRRDGRRDGEGDGEGGEGGKGGEGGEGGWAEPEKGSTIT